VYERARGRRAVLGEDCNPDRRRRLPRLHDPRHLAHRPVQARGRPPRGDDIVAVSLEEATRSLHLIEAKLYELAESFFG
jgi:hypothetical protein